MRVYIVAVPLVLNGLACADPIPAASPTKYSISSLTSSLPSSSPSTIADLSTSSTTTSSTITSRTTTSTTTTTTISNTDTSTSSTTTTPACTPTQPPIGVADANGWEYEGCQPDTPDHILYPGPTTFDTNTFEDCREYCSTGANGNRQYPYIGLQQGNLCWCSYALESDPTLAGPAATCNARCAGDDCQFCGGSDSIDIYYNPTIAETAPTIKRVSNDYNYQGCYEDRAGSKLLLESSYQDTDGFVVDDCTAFCYTSAGGQGGSAGNPNAYQMAGVENGSTCYCANRIRTDDPVEVNDRECDTICNGDPDEFCGGGSSGLRLQVYQLQE